MAYLIAARIRRRDGCRRVLNTLRPRSQYPPSDAASEITHQRRRALYSLVYEIGVGMHCGGQLLIEGRITVNVHGALIPDGWVISG